MDGCPQPRAVCVPPQVRAFLPGHGEPIRVAAAWAYRALRHVLGPVVGPPRPHLTHAVPVNRHVVLTPPVDHSDDEGVAFNSFTSSAGPGN
jgi:hypothetical protein